MDSKTDYFKKLQEKHKLFLGLDSFRQQMRSVNNIISTTPILLRAFIGILLLMGSPLVFALILIIVVGKFLLSVLKETLTHIGAVFLILIVGVPLYLYLSLTLPFRTAQDSQLGNGSMRGARMKEEGSSEKGSSRSSRRRKSPTLN